MPRCEVGKENGSPVEIYYEDHGSGEPVLLIHGYPLDSNSWENQERALLGAGYRVIRYDRRGFGQSSKPTVGYDYDTFAADMKALVDRLGLDRFVPVGFSMGSGEVTRFIGRYGTDRIPRAALFGAIPPFLLRTDDNPEGVELEVWNGIKERVLKDRYAWFKQFLDDFYNVDVFSPERISDQAWKASFNVAAAASPHASYASVDSWLEDFRDDVAKFDLPTLLVHGSEDRILPIAATGDRLPDLISDLRYVRIDGGPHNVGWTHPEEVNKALLEFLKER